MDIWVILGTQIIQPAICRSSFFTNSKFFSPVVMELDIEQLKRSSAELDESMPSSRFLRDVRPLISICKMWIILGIFV